MNRWMKNFFQYLDRFYVAYNSLPTLEEAGHRLFRSIIFDAIKKDVIMTIMAMIDEEREGRIIDHGLIKDCVSLFGTTSNAGYFESHFLQSTREFYAHKAAVWIMDKNPANYLKQVDAVLRSERLRTHSYLLSESESRLVCMLETELLEKRESELLGEIVLPLSPSVDSLSPDFTLREFCELIYPTDSGCRQLITHDGSGGENLSRLFGLMARLPKGLESMADGLRQYIVALGSDRIARAITKLSNGSVSASHDAIVELVTDLIYLHEKYLRAVTNTFQKNASFQRALRDAFTELVNQSVGESSSQKVLATFCDHILKPNGVRLLDEAVEHLIEKAGDLFAHLADKDLFESHYRSMLASRLLTQRYCLDLEKATIARLKRQSGTLLTSKLEGMVNDIALSSEHQTDFENFLANKSTSCTSRSSGLSLPIEFSAQILNSTHWPRSADFQRTSGLILPDCMTACMAMYGEFYKAKTERRRLDWTHTMGSAFVDGTFRACQSTRMYRLELNTLQAVVLLLFNGLRTLSLDEVQQRTNLHGETLWRIMRSFCHCKLLLKSRDATSGADVYTANRGFSSSRKRFRVAMPLPDSPRKPQQEAAVEEDRKAAIEAAIVRIMKARKTITHQLLVAETLTQLSLFRPDPKVIKRRIESLIDREFLQRTDGSPDTYSYIA